jgi:putative ABC transport system permease protein
MTQVRRDLRNRHFIPPPPGRPPAGPCDEGTGATRRRREMGIRMALGAAPASVVALVTRAGLRLTATGIASGLLGALALARRLESLLFGVTPPTLAAASAVLAAAALAASLLPALRAARVDAAITMREE